MHKTEEEVLDVKQPIVREPAPLVGIVGRLAAKYGEEEQAFGRMLIDTVFPDGKGTVSQVRALCAVAAEYDLNPLTKQIYAFPGKGGGITPVISVDGWYAIANRQPQFDGIEFEYIDENGKPIACTATVHRKDRKHPTVVTEYVSECKRNTPPWNNQTRRMIRHRAAIQAIRVAFGISAIDPEEAERIPEYEVEAGAEPVAAVAAINAKLEGDSSVDTKTGEVTIAKGAPNPAVGVVTTSAEVEEVVPPPAEVPLEDEPSGALFEDEGPSETGAFEL